MARNQQVTRLLKILESLSANKNGLTVGDLSAELNVTPRTIYRDLDALQDSGFPLTSNLDGTQAFWKFVDGYRLKMSAPFSAPELMGLYFCRDLIKPLKGTIFEASLSGAMDKIRAGLTTEMIEFVDASQDAFKAGLRGHARYENYRDMINLVNQSILHGESLQIHYHSYSSRKASQREIDPYRLYYHEGSLYVIGHCYKAGEVRTFAVERVRLAEKSGRCFKVPDDFDLDAYFKDSFGVFRQELTKVIVAFDANVALFVESKIWHDSQVIEKQPNGHLKITFHVGGTREIKAWVMGFCEHAEVLEPVQLREEISQDIRKMHGIYGEAKALRQTSKVMS